MVRVKTVGNPFSGGWLWNNSSVIHKTDIAEALFGFKIFFFLSNQLAELNWGSFWVLWAVCFENWKKKITEMGLWNLTALLASPPLYEKFIFDLEPFAIAQMNYDSLLKNFYK